MEMDNETIERIKAVEADIAYHSKALEKLKEQKESYVGEIIQAMKAESVDVIEQDGVRIKYVAPVERIVVDSTALKRKYPEIASECSKTSTTKESLKITIKQKEEE